MSKVMIGDLFASKMQTLVNTVNCVGVMGKGVALEFKTRYPAMFKDYQTRCAAGQVRLGEPYLYRDVLGVSILNFPTKDHWRSPSRLEDIVRGLDYLAEHLDAWDIRSLAMPPLGCGNGGLDWAVAGPLIYQRLLGMDVDFELYAPYGTPQAQLSPAFLGVATSVEKARGRQAQKLNPAWLTVLDVVDQIARQPYAPPVGRTILQKIAYVLTEQGVETGFAFGQGSYGPFSPEVQDAVKVFANTNLIEEQTLGRMTAIRIGSAFARFRQEHAEVLKRHEKKIDKAVDLFSRIKNTTQAEEVTTVLFASRKLKAERGQDVTEKDLFDFILGWKRDWATPSKQTAVAEAIRHLEMLSWLKIGYSDNLPVEA